jgi:hypothetical protein
MKRLNLYIVLLALASAITFTLMLPDTQHPTQGVTRSGFLEDLEKDKAPVAPSGKVIGP